jgi:hypothetical protein
MKRSSAAPRRQLPGSPFNVPEPERTFDEFSVLDLVTHDKYGLGMVTAVEGLDAVLVDFGAYKARISIPCTKLTKL